MKHGRWIVAGLIALGLMLGVGGSVGLAQDDAAEASAPQAVQEARPAPPSDDAAAPEPPEIDAVAQLQAEIDAMLSPEGLVQPRRIGYGDRLEAIASASNTIARDNKDHPDVQFRAQQIELRAYNALAQAATADDQPVVASYRLTQLRNAAAQTKASGNRYAQATGDFWLLVADLTDINRVGGGVQQRQGEAVQKLEDFVATHPAEATPVAVAAEVKTALIRLHDQAGDNARACALLTDLRQSLPEEDARLQALADVDATCQRLGKPAAVEVQTIDGQTWSSKSKQGKRVLLHCYADWSEQSVAMFDQIESRRGPLRDAGVEVLSISAGPTQRGVEGQSWPVAAVEPGPDSVITELGVRGLPWLIVLDAQGDIAHVGRTAQVIDRAAAGSDAAADGGEVTEQD